MSNADTMTEAITLKALHVAAKSADAYSAEFWGSVLWVQAAEMLIGMGFTDDEVEGVLRSKLTRWARDAYGKPETYLGQLSYLVSHANATDRLHEYL